MSKKKVRLGTIPDGSCVEAFNGKYYYMTGGVLRLIQSKDILKSWRFPTYFYLNEKLFSTYEVSGKVGFRPGSIVASLSERCYYYISPTAKHKVGRDFLKDAGVSMWQVPLVSGEDLNLHKTGGEIE